jgi:leucyl/phenylalanyl-tRNA--protein transferase
MSFALPWLDHDPRAPFPPVAQALREPDGLLAAGGDLSPERLLRAYRSGIFPWFSDGQPILWWSPDPRMVFATDTVHLPRRFRRSLRASPWIARADTAFDDVVAACAQVPRAGQRGTWISDDMRAAYGQMHRLGHAHSVEVFDGADLVGGIYGVAIGRMFFGESMFSARSGGSKVALASLARRLYQWDWPWIDAQVENPHLLRMGARPVVREAFLARVTALVGEAEPNCAWTGRFGEFRAQELAT